MIQTRWTAIPEKGDALCVDAAPRCRDREVGEWVPSGSRGRVPSAAGPISRLLAAAILVTSALTSSGCLTASKHSKEDRTNPSGMTPTAGRLSLPAPTSASDPSGLFRLQ